MNIGGRAMAAALGAVLLAGAAATPASAGTGSGNAGNWTVQVTVDDHTRTEHGCEMVPVTVVTSGTPSDWELDLDVRLRGSGSASSWIWTYGDGAGVFTDDFQVCPSFDPSGTYDITGSFEAGPSDNRVKVPISTSYTLSRMPSQVSLSATGEGGWTTFSGRATSQSATLGTIGSDGDGTVVIEALIDGSWTQVDYTWPDLVGAFSTSTYQSFRAGTRFRAVYEGSETSAGATSGEAVLQLPRPQVTIKTIGARSKFRVDVNPNKGRGHWVFKVQRLNVDGATWRTLPTSYKTLGSKETRTVNLRKGTYRVVVQPKYGMDSQTSAAVTLRR